MQMGLRKHLEIVRHALIELMKSVGHSNLKHNIIWDRRMLSSCISQPDEKTWLWIYTNVRIENQMIVIKDVFVGVGRKSLWGHHSGSPIWIYVLRGSATWWKGDEINGGMVSWDFPSHGKEVCHGARTAWGSGTGYSTRFPVTDQYRMSRKCRKSDENLLCARCRQVDSMDEGLSNVLREWQEVKEKEKRARKATLAKNLLDEFDLFRLMIVYFPLIDLNVNFSHLRMTSKTRAAAIEKQVNEWMSQLTGN